MNHRTLPQMALFLAIGDEKIAAKLLAENVLQIAPTYRLEIEVMAKWLAAHLPGMPNPQRHLPGYELRRMTGAPWPVINGAQLIGKDFTEQLVLCIDSARHAEAVTAYEQRKAARGEVVI